MYYCQGYILKKFILFFEEIILLASYRHEVDMRYRKYRMVLMVALLLLAITRPTKTKQKKAERGHRIITYGMHNMLYLFGQIPSYINTDLNASQGIA